MRRPILLPFILVAACSEVPGAIAATGARSRSRSGYIARPTDVVAFAPSPSRLAPPKRTRVPDVRISASRIGPLNMMVPSDALWQHTPSSLLPTILTSYDDVAAQAEAFQDTVSLSDLTSDPFLRTAFVASAVAIILLVVAKSIVTSMDEGVRKTAVEFDKIMTSTYPRKWEKFIDENKGVVGSSSSSSGDAKEDGDRIQAIVEEMEVLWETEPEFMARVIREIDTRK